MSKITVDFSDVETDVVSVGDHSVMVHEVDVRPGTDEPYINWDLIITEGEYEGRHVFARTSLTKRSLWRLYNFVGALGFEEEMMELEYDDETGVILFPEFIGSVAIASVYHSEYQGRDVAQVDEIRPMSGPLPVKATAPQSDTSLEEEEFEEEEIEEEEVEEKKPKIKLR